MDKNRETWNKCDICGRFISYSDFDKREAIRTLETPDSYFSDESYKTLCKKCVKKEKL